MAMTEELNTPEVTAATVAPATNKRWYVVHAYSGMEKAVERNLRERIDRSEMQEKFGRILVPMEEVVELKNGKKSVSERRFFPGYVLVEMEMADDSWHLVKHTSKVTGFVGGAKNRPRCSGKWANWCASRKARSPTSTAPSKTSTTTNRKCAWRSRSSVVPRRSSSTSRRSRRFESLLMGAGAARCSTISRCCR
jgi:Transcription termination factor nusG